MAGTLHRALRNKYVLGSALALVIAPFASIDRAMAACAPPSGHDNVTVTCSSNTTNQDGTNGYGQGTENGVTVNVNSGVTVRGTDIGIALSPTGNPATTLNNSGTVTGATGFRAGNNVTVTNTLATSQIIGTTGTAIDTHGNLIVTNSGSIRGATNGIFTANVTLTNISTGTIDGVANGIVASDQANISNAGAIRSSGGAAIVDHHIATVSSNTGTISGLTFGIDATEVSTITNNFGGTIGVTGANGVAIGSSDTTPINTVTLANAGVVQANGAGGIAILGQTVNVTSNSGTISGNAAGIDATGTATVSNQGVITSSDGDGIAATTVNVIANAGTISGGVRAIDGVNAVTVTSNTGTISSTNDAIRAAMVTVTSNTGTISSIVGDGIHAIGTGTATVTNSGSITGADAIFAVTTATVTNSGAITANSNNGVGVAALQSVTITNAGMVRGGTSGSGIVTGTLNLVNSGTITGQTAIVAHDATTITNSGTIQSTAGAAGTAIQLSSAVDTLNIKNGSNIVGLIDMGHGADVINVDSTAPSVPKGVSMLSRATSAVIDALKQQLRNFDGVINIIGGGSPSLQPTVTVNGRTASLDPTALAQQDRTLMDFTGGMSSMVQGRLGGAATGSGPQAMSYAMEADPRNDARAEMFTKAPAASSSAPVNVWTSAFGVSRSQNGTDVTLDSTASVYGGVIGVDRRIRPDWLVGAFAGGGSGTLNVDLSSQKVDTDYVSGGAYSRFEWASQFLDITLQAGSTDNRSTRLIQNNITGSEHATASYNGWFVSPEVAYGYRINLGSGTTVTPTVRARYVAGFFDGYTETGSAQSLSIGSRTLQDFEERGEVEVAKVTSLFGGDHVFKLTFHGGVISLQRAGDASVNAVLIGQSMSFITPGKSSAVGGVGGVGFDYHVSPNVALFGALEGTMMSDESRVGSAKGGVRVAF